jgi:hypothetical protein
VSGVPEIAAAVRAPAGGGHTPPEASRVSVSPGSVETADTSAVTLYAVCLSVCLSVCLGAVLFEGGALGADSGGGENLPNGSERRPL